MIGKTLVFGIIPLMTACSSYSLDSKMSSSDESGYYYDTGAQNVDPNEGPDSDGEFDDGLGSEEESDFLALRPATTNTYVFVANPDRNTVTRINVETLGVITVEVGVEPSISTNSISYLVSIDASLIFKPAFPIAFDF